MASRRLRLPEDFKIDLTPVLSLIVHLIPMLLLAVRFDVLAQHQTNSPPLQAADSPSREVAEKQDETPPAVRISEEGFVVRGAGLLPTTLPCRGACAFETYDYDGLGRLLEEAKANRPGERAVVIAPDPAITYDVVVRVFDAAGRRGDHELFPTPLIVTGRADP